ncbi:HzsA-related protein [Denitromonas ohlonensis]|uniref:Hydrazine synthase alpha subunit middle domain-containing protein n=2 Tax=Denitromonas TaxID=139331 RepID=A0A557SIQ0_9RHOO|nr:hypothetical protein [Denitromonas ohlonensis]TVO69191.1 hypothetical protein FHP90_00940 [Denitromonas ohlonensis]TVO77291.1 hypothetical protein FHP89_08170 [Denitromonas ohlonensis]
MRWMLALLLVALASIALADDDTTTPLIWVEFDIDRTPSQYQGMQFDHPDVCISLPEVNNRVHNQKSAGNAPNGISGPGRLMRRDKTGRVTVLYDCAAAGKICMPTDPRLSFDGTKVAFTLYHGSQWEPVCGSRNRVLAGVSGASVAIHDLVTGSTTAWPYKPGQHDLTPAFVNQNGRLRVTFSSDRDREYEPLLPRMSVQGYANLQTYFADLDGANVVKTGYHDMASFYGATQIRDGRLIGSCAQWGHDLAYIGYGPVYTNYPGTLLNQWWICATDPWGGSQESSFGAHYRGRALHWVSQLQDGRLAVGEYYRGNNNQGAGKIFLWSPKPFTVEGVPVREAKGRFAALNPRDLLDVASWANGNDEKAHFDFSNARYKGKIRDPFGLPGNALGFVWCQGMCNKQMGLKPDGNDRFVEQGPDPSRRPANIVNPVGIEIGIYKLPADKIPSDDYQRDPVRLIDRPGVAEYGAIYGGPYIDVHGQATPDNVAQPRSEDGKCYLHIASQQSETKAYPVLHGNYRWGHQELSPLLGKELVGVKDADVKYIRITQVLPNTERVRNFAGEGRQWWSVWGYRGAILGDAPVESDGSANIEVPCDVPWVLSGLNADHEVIRRDMMPQSLRPGTVLSCGGCHNHNDIDASPEFSGSLAAMQPPTRLLVATRQPEYNADIVPILNRRCVSCHRGSQAAGGIDFDDRDASDGMTTVKMLINDFEQKVNPRPVQVHQRSEGYSEKAVYRLDRPHISWLINGNYAAGSAFYWYFKGRRADYRTNASTSNDIDFNAAHPDVGASAEEVTVVRNWIDTGAFVDPTVPAPRYDGEGTRRVPPSPGVSGGGQAGAKGGGGGGVDRQPVGYLSAPERPAKTGGGPAGKWAWFPGVWQIANERYFDPHGVDFQWAYSRTDPVPPRMRLFVHLHGSSAGNGAGMTQVFAPPLARAGQIELRNQDAEAHQGAWRESWAYGADGQIYAGRRLAGSIEYLLQRYPQIDVDKLGIVLKGGSMGGGGAVSQSMILPDPWRARIAYVTGAIGLIMPRRIAQRNPGMYAGWPPDRGGGRVSWDRIDFAIQAERDPVVRGIHYRHVFSTDDGFSAGPDGNTQLEFVNLVEKHRIGGAFSWFRNGHNSSEPGVSLPALSEFEAPEQDVTLDRAHPAFTRSTGNHPLLAEDRVDEARFPRGHYNMGLLWDHAKIVDTASQLVFPIRYKRRTGIGAEVPDQPARITVSVTPRRSAHFRLHEGERIRWSWDGGALEGSALVLGDTVTADGIPLISGEPYKTLRFYK